MVGSEPHRRLTDTANARLEELALRASALEPVYTLERKRPARPCQIENENSAILYLAEAY